jgi:hypothetical protein
MRVLLWATVIAAAMAVAATAGSASAQSANHPSVVDAEAHRAELYREGVEAATAGRWGDARALFEGAAAIRSSPKVLFSLAQAEEQLGLFATATADYGHALDGAKLAGEKDVVAAAEHARASVAPRVPHLRVRLAGSAPTASATLDDKLVSLEVPIPVDPGTHRLVVTASGMRAASASVAIGERQELDVPVTLEPEPTAIAMAPAAPASTPSAPPVRSSGPPWRVISLVAAGFGLVGIGVGSYFGVEAMSKNSQSDAAGGCVGDNCPQAAATLRHDALSAATASTAAFVVGGALVAGGVVVWLVAPKPRGDARVGVTPNALVGGRGLSIVGRW